MKQLRIYIITNPIYEISNMYKIGYHTGSKKDLRSRYITALPDLEIVRFTDSVTKQDEKDLHTIFAEHRHNNSEWFKIEKTELLAIYDKFFTDKKITIDYQSLVDMQNQIIELQKENKWIKEEYILFKNEIKDQMFELCSRIELLENNQILKQEQPKDISKCTNISISIPHEPNMTDFDNFINYIKYQKPAWYIPHGWVHQHIIYDNFISMYSRISSKMFTLQMKDRIFDQKKQKRINNSNKTAFLLFDWDQIN